MARTYFKQIINGLEACHNAGVAHRDIKPQNLLLDSRFNIKLTDFGLSKVFESDADAIMKTTYVGTRGYQAPELLLDQPYDLACDVFSMGLYHANSLYFCVMILTVKCTVFLKL